jgi:hypothetical protein
LVYGGLAVAVHAINKKSRRERRLFLLDPAGSYQLQPLPQQLLVLEVRFFAERAADARRGVRLEAALRDVLLFVVDLRGVDFDRRVLTRLA